MPSKLDQLIEAMPPLGELATKTLSELQILGSWIYIPRALMHLMPTRNSWRRCETWTRKLPS